MLLASFVLVYGCKRVVFVRLCTGIAREYQGDGLTILAIAIERLTFRKHLTQWWAVFTIRLKLEIFFQKRT